MRGQPLPVRDSMASGHCFSMFKKQTTTSAAKLEQDQFPSPVFPLKYMSLGEP